MKVYLWSGSGVLQDYSSGAIIVIAETREEAQVRAREAVEKIWGWIGEWSDQELDAQFFVEPTVHNIEGFAFAIAGRG